MLFRQLIDKQTSTYTYLLADDQSKEAVLIDSVDEQISRDLGLISELGLKLLYVFDTHVHADHITGGGPIQKETGAKFLAIDADVRGADDYLKDGDEIVFGRHRLKVLHTPGHTGTCTSFLLDDETMVFTGDTLFIRGCGRTDFQAGDPATLFHSVTTKLFTLPDHCLVYPGHDYKGRTCSTIGEEKRFNPRLAGTTEAEFIQIMNGLNLADPARMKEAVPANLNRGLPNN